MHDDDIKRKLKAWMKIRNRKREWVAEKVGVTKGTLDKWMSSKPIPELKQKLLMSLMLADEVVKGKTSNEQVVLDFTVEQYEAVRLEAERRGITVEEWSSEVLSALANVTVRVR